MNKLLIKQKDKAIIVSFKDIVYCSSSSNYSILYLENKKLITMTQSLTILKRQLCDNFLRISQSYVINLDHIIEIYPQKREVLMSNGERLKFTIKYTDLCSLLNETFLIVKNEV